MKNYKELFLSVLKNNGESASNFVAQASKAIENFNIDEMMEKFQEKKAVILDKAKELVDDITTFVGEIQDALIDKTVVVDFDEEKGEEIECSIEGDTLKIKVTFEGDNEEYVRTKKVTIPSGVTMDDIDVQIDPEKKQAIITFGQTDEDEEELDAGVDGTDEAAPGAGVDGTDEAEATQEDETARRISEAFENLG